ncbi:MAG: hypothetical protein ABFD12_07070 [Syntrophorhabdus sp.]
MNFVHRIFIEPFDTLYENFTTFIPNFLTALALLVIGIIIGTLLRTIFYKIFRAFHLDSAAERVGLIEMFARGGIHGTFSAFLARFIGWFVIVIFAIASIQVLKIPALENLLARFLLYLPNIITAAGILLVGYLFSNFFGRAALIAAVNAGIKRAGLVGRFVRLIVFILAATMAMEQLGIGRDTVLISFTIIFGGIILALAIAFGFGGTDIARDYLQRHVDKKVDHDGKDIGDINPL